MKTQDLDYYLPDELVAQQPADIRSESRLLVLDRKGGRIADKIFSDIGNYLRKGDCLVLNDTKVLPARFYGKRVTGAVLEGLFLADKGKNLWQVMLKGVRKLKAGEVFNLFYKEKNGAFEAEFVDKTADKCLIKVYSDLPFERILEKIGFTPLPPYIKRGDDIGQDELDKRRYQTVYAEKRGAVAAPTAGLHFTEDLMKRLKSKGVVFAYVTLHVGAGTFKPVSEEILENHHIHTEKYSINDENADIIGFTKKTGGRIIAVGTTAVRVLETIGKDGDIKQQAGETNLFILPGFDFKVVDAMVTNFHLPRSTLLALVAAFAGLDTTLQGYRHAVEQRYRFYSYGDAMFIY